MRYVFFGTPRFAALILERLCSVDISPVAVVCNPDKPAGRKGVLTPPPVKIVRGLASDMGILQPETLKGNTELEKQLRQYNADVFILAAYGKIVPKEIFSIPPHGTIVVHPSLLPKYRGATPIQSAILAGEEKTGTALFLMDEEIDHGPILVRKETNIDNKNYLQLEEELANMSADLLIASLPNYIAGEITPEPQDHSAATFTKKFSTEDAYVDLIKDDHTIIERKIRALNPEPGVWTMRNSVRTKLLEATFENGGLVFTKIQSEGKRPAVCNIAAEAFAD